ANRRHPLAGKLASLHADDVEAFKHRMLAVDQAERDNVATHTANAANHHLRADPGELMHRGETPDVNEVADLTMAAERCGGREDYVVTDATIVADMGIVHEVSAFADAGDATAFGGPDVHGHALADRAASADFKPGRLVAIAEILRRPAERGKR